VRYDIGIVGGRVVDGSGNPWYRGDLAVRGDSIARIGRVDPQECKKVVDASGCYVCPGFVDIHTHSDTSVFRYPGCDSTLRQGVTTHLAGNCGDSGAPVRRPHDRRWREYMEIPEDQSWESFEEYLRAVEGLSLGHNIATLVGHNAVRTAVIGPDERAPDAAELEDMCSLVDEAMRAGAYGLSTGLVYPPGCFADTDEIVALAKVAASHGGMYASHIRGERETILEAISEAIDIGRRSGARVQISHNCPKVGASGRTRETLGLVERAREEGLDVTIDNDVHTDFGPRLAQALPQYLHKLPTAELMKMLKEEEFRERVKREIVEDKLPAPGYGGLLRHGLFDRIFLLSVPGEKPLEGKTVADVARARGRAPLDTYLDLLVETEDRARTICDYIDEEDIRALLAHPLMMVSSDCATRSVDAPGEPGDVYEPCAFGEYPGILERYVREEKLITIEEAVRKMTSFPAQKIGLFDRGLLRPGMKADIAVVDLGRVRDRATNRWPHEYPFENYPHQYPDGIPHVIVNGGVAVEDGEQTLVGTGAVLRHRLSGTA